jgi:hypothetical protein
MIFLTADFIGFIIFGIPLLISSAWPYIIGLLFAWWFFHSISKIVDATCRTADSTEMSHRCLAELVRQVHRREVERGAADAIERELHEFAHQQHMNGRAV